MSAKRGGRRTTTRAKTKAIDKAIESMEKVAEVLENGTTSDLTEDPLVLPGFDPGAEEDIAKEEIYDLFSSLPGNEDYYLKIYKRKPLPANMRGPEFKTEITDIKSITDLEVTVRDMAVENEWGSGEYEIVAMRKGGAGDVGRPRRIAKPVIVTIDIQSKKKDPQDQDLRGKLSEVGEVVRMVKEFMPGQQPASDLTRCLTDTFKSSIDTVKSMMPPQNGNQTNILDIIKTLKEAGMFGKDTSRPLCLDDVLKTVPVLIAAVKDLGIFNRKEEKKESMLEVIKQLRESGIIKVVGEDKSDPMDTIGKVVEMMNTLSPLMRGGEGEVSPVIELIRTVGPHVPKIVEDVTGTIRDVADIARIKLAAQMGVRPEQLTAPRTTERPEPAPVQIPTGEPQITEIIPTPQPPAPKKEETVVRNPLVQEILDAIEKNDTGYYAKLQQIIPTYLGAQVWDPLISGQATPEMFCQTMSTILNEPGINTDKAREYVTLFVKWCQDEEEKNLIIARCKACHAEVEFLSEDEWTQDGKKCEDCGGELERVTT